MKFFSWDGWINANDWDEVEVQCRPCSVIILWVSCLAFLCIIKYVNYVNIIVKIDSIVVPSILFSVGFLSSILSWINKTKLDGKLYPVFVITDSIFISSATVMTAVSCDTAGKFVFIGIYFATMYHWGSMVSLNFYGLVSCSIGPFIVLALIESDIFVWSIVAFSVLLYVVLSKNMTMRKRFRKKEERFKDVITVIDGILDRYSSNDAQEIKSKADLALHDLKNVIGSSMLDLSLLSRNIGSKNPENDELLLDIRSTLKRAVNDATKYLRDVRSNSKKSHFNMSDVVSFIYDISMNSKGKIVNSINGDSHLDIRGSKNNLCIALRNLIDNSFAAGAKKVDISTVKNGECVKFIVEDDGPGIPDNVKQKLFVPCVSTKKSGTGLGLFLCRRLVKMCNGDIKLESSKVGRTVFSIKLKIFEDKKSIASDFSLDTRLQN